jgi:RNA-directed DNA polymerase
MWRGILPAHGFMPAASPKALTAISRTIRRWTLHQRSDKSLQDLANMYNPYIGGWINYYGQFYRAQLRSPLQRISSPSSAGKFAVMHHTALIRRCGRVRSSA